MGKERWRHALRESGKVLAAGVLTLCLALLAVEACLSVAGVTPHGHLLVSKDNCYFGWEAHAHDRSTKAHLVHDTRTDAAGFRVPSSGESSPRAACEVLALGDSSTEGFYVEANQAWPAVLEVSLRQAGYDIAVRNGGMRAHTILQQRIAALGRWAAHRPDLVIVQQTGNDLMDLATSRASGCGPDTKVATTFGSALPEVVKQWRFFRVVQDAGLQIEGTLQGNASSAGRAEPTLNPQACEALAADYVGEVGRLAAGLQQNGAHLLVANWEPLACNAGGGSQWTVDGLAQAKSYAQMPLTFVDAHDTLQEDNTMLLPVDAHPSALGHTLFARRLAQRLIGSPMLAHCRH